MEKTWPFCWLLSQILGAKLSGRHAVFGQQGHVPGVDESARRVAGNPAGVHDGQFRRTAAGGRHGQLCVVGRPPRQHGWMNGETGIGLVRLADHCLHLDAVTAGQQMPERDVLHWRHWHFRRSR